MIFRSVHTSAYQNVIHVIHLYPNFTRVIGNQQWCANLKNSMIRHFLNFQSRIRDLDSGCCQDKSRIRDSWFATFWEFKIRIRDSLKLIWNFRFGIGIRLESENMLFLGFGSIFKIRESYCSIAYLETRKSEGSPMITGIRKEIIVYKYWSGNY